MRVHRRCDVGGRVCFELGIEPTGNHVDRLAANEI
jgi:hypothetical protein